MSTRGYADTEREGGEGKMGRETLEAWRETTSAEALRTSSKSFSCLANRNVSCPYVIA